jgi:hypothetical protein
LDRGDYLLGGGDDLLLERVGERERDARGGYRHAGQRREADKMSQA